MKRPLAYITATWSGNQMEDGKRAAEYCRAVYEAGFSPLCPILYLPLILNDAIPEEHKSGIDIGRDLLRRAHVLVVCGDGIDEDVQALLKRIGVDGVRYEEIFITDFESDVLGLYDYLNEYDNIDELNHLAHILSELDQSDLEKFEAAIAYGEHTSSVKDLINLAQNLDCYDFIPGIEDEEDLGRYYIEELDALQVPEHLKNYIDYEAYGRDVSMEENSSFVPGGYVRRESDIVEVYHGREASPPNNAFSPIQISISAKRFRPTRKW